MLIIFYLLVLSLQYQLYILYVSYNFMEWSVPHDPVHVPIVAKHIYRKLSLLLST